MSAREAWLGGRRIASATAWIAAFAFVAFGPVAIAAALPGETGQVAFTRAGDVWSTSPDGTGEVQLTSGPADDRWPRWSPEGNRIAIVRDGDLVLLRADGSVLRVLTTHADVVGAPSWAPDGLRLVYARGAGGIFVVEATQAGSDGTRLDVGQVTSVAWNPIQPDQIAYTDGASIFTVAPDGSGITELIPPDPDSRTREEPAWDPQSGQVVFMSTGPDGTRIEGAGVSLDGAFGFDRSPAWSPDGQQMLFSRSGVLHVYRREGFPDSGNVRSLGIDGEMPDVQPALISSVAAYETNTGTALHFQVRPFGAVPMTIGYQTVAGAGSATEGTDYAGQTGTVEVRPLSNPVTVLISILGDADPEPDETFFVDFTFPSDPAAPLRVRGTIVNDDGARNGVITYTGDNASFLGVHALDPFRGGSESIVSPAGSAVFSPTGDRLAYLHPGAGGQLELVVADTSGTPQVTFPVPGGAIDDELAWSPDGLRLAWTEGGALRVADPSSASSARQIATDALQASWSADAGPGPRRLVFRRWSTGAICTIREDGSGETCLTVAGDEPRWSPDNSTIAFLGAASVFLMDPSGSNVRAVAPAPAALAGNRRLRWSPRGGVLAFATGDALFTVQEGTPAVPVAGLPPTIWGFDWSPDGQQLVVQASDPTSSFHLWIVGPDDLGRALARARRVTSLLTTAQEPRWSSAPPRPTANLASRGGIERFGQVRAEVELDAPSPETATFEWQTVNTGTATPDVDYTPVSFGTVVLQPGETRGAIVVEVVNDAVEEGPEFFEVRLTSASAARLGPDTQVQVYITDDDGSPMAVNDVVATDADTPIDIAVLANDRDSDGDPLTLTTVGSPAHGTATFTGGIVTYTPQAGFEGVDYFLYSVSDGHGHTASAAVSVSVGDEPLPPPPVLTVSPSFLDFGQVPVNKTKDLVVTVTNNTGAPVALAENFFLEQGDPRPFDASSVDGDSCRWPWFRELGPGVSCTQEVRFYSVPGAGAASPARARLLDNVTFETLATIPLFASVGPPDTGPNSPPNPVDDLAGVAPGFTHSLYALVNDSDPDDDLLRIVAVSDPPHGTASVAHCNVFPINSNIDCIQYVPDAGYLGIDAVVYTVSDGRGGTASATYHLAVGNLVPNITGITPSSGPTAGGQAVRITGSNFVYGSDVRFECPGGAYLPLAVTQLTDTEILASTPASFPGVCALRVLTRLGQNGVLANAYRYEEASTTPTTTVLATSGSPSRLGQAVTFTATVAAVGGPAPAPQGSVQFDDTTTGTTLGTATLDAAGIASVETTVLAVGTHVMTATYLPGSGSPYAGSSGSLTQVVDPPSADVSIAATAGPDPVAAGSVLTYTAIVTNGGPDVAHGVALSLPVAASLGFVGSQPPGVCTGPAPGVAGTIHCNLGELASGASRTVVIETRPTAAGPLASTLTVTGNEPDPDPADNAVTLSVTVRLDPVVIDVAENIVVAEAPIVTPPLVLVVPETIVVTDTTTLTPSVMLTVPENVVVSDTPTVAPPLMLTVTENIAVADATAPRPSVMLGVAETIVVTDVPALVVVDTTPPTVTIDQAAGQPDPTSRTPIEFIVTFSEPVTGFDASDISFAGSTVGGSLSAQFDRGPGASLTVFVSGMTGTGAVVASIPAGAAVDAHGNPSLASTSTDNSVRFELVSTTTTLTSSRNPSLTTAPPVFTATVTSAGSGAQPTGEVEFLQGGVVFGTSPLFERGGAMVAVIGRPTLIVNESTHTITARYLGDPGHEPSGSAPLLQAVHPGTYYAENVSGPASPMTPVAFNDAGQIAGNLGNGVLSRAAVFDPVLGFRTPDNVSPFSEALDLNEAGIVIGRRGQDTLTTVGFTDRNGILDSIPLSVSATGVNGRDQIAINLENGNGAALYEGTASTPLDVFEARAINDGSVVVGSVLAADGQPEAVLWQGGTLTNLGRFGQAFASATRVSNAGTVLVRAGDLFGPELPFLLHRDGQIAGLGTGRAWDVNDADVAVVGADEARVHVGATVLTLDVGPVTGMAVNNRGEIVGSVSGQLKRWTPVPISNLAVNPASGFEGDTVTLSARLTLFGGAPAAGRLITFRLNGQVVGSAPTRPSGIAVLNGVSLTGLPIGEFPAGVRATYAGSPTLGASTATATLSIYAIDPADLVVQVTASPAQVTVGSNVTFNAAVSNLGPSNAAVVRLSVALPAGLQYISNNAPAACTFTGGQGTCNFSNLAPAATRGLQVVARPTTGSPQTATFVVSGLRHDPNPANNSASVTVDASPTVTINQAAGQADPTATSPIQFTVVFSEPVTGFAGSDISFAGSTVGGTLSAGVTGSGANYTVSVTGMSGLGNVAVSIPAGAAVDGGGKSSLASTSTDRTVFYTIGRVFGSVSPTNGGNIVFAVANSGGQVGGVLSFSRGNVSYTALRIISLVISGQTATFEGFDNNNRFFVATAFDGSSGQPDRFRLWIEGVEQTPVTGAISSGSVTVQPWSPDTRLKGWVDLHTHPMSNIAFGGKLFHGAPSVGSLMPSVQMPNDPGCRHDVRATSIGEALSQDGPTRGDFIQSACGDSVRNALIKAIEGLNGAQTAPAGADGFPAFTYWPRWDDITHQKMWIDWIRRSWQYGQRVMVALSHNNRVVGDLVTAGGAGSITGVTDDKASSALQIEEIKRLVADHSSFMAVARTPDELRSIVEGGRLAVVLGVEIDKLGNLGPGATPQMIDAEIAALHATGVRYVLPIHLTDNVFGDTALYQDFYNLLNVAENGAWWAVGCATRADQVAFEAKSLGSIFNPFLPPNAPQFPSYLSCRFQRNGVIEFDGHVNARTANGLASLGDFAIAAMMKRGMIVDIDHMSDRAANRTLTRAAAVPGGGYPVMSGHTGIRDRSAQFGAENSRTTTQLARIACLGGMFGLGTGASNGTRAVDWTTQYARGYEIMRRAFAPGGLCPQETPLGVAFIGLGTDANSLVKTPRPPMLDPVGPPRSTDIYNPNNPLNAGVSPLSRPPRNPNTNTTWDYNVDGVAHYGMFADFLRDVRTLPANATMNGRQIVDDQMMYGADYFYRMWLKADTQKARVP